VGLALLDRRPTAAATLGALRIAVSGILFRVADVSPSTGAFYRCAFAVPLLLVAGGLEDRSLGRRTRPERLVLLAISAQLFAWLLISFSLPRLPAGVSSVLLTAQSVASVVLAMLLLSESPSWAQLLGAATILAGLAIVASGRKRIAEAPVPEAG
jgi:drug/metabolite transporter (DMT)-like permease